MEFLDAKELIVVAFFGRGNSKNPSLFCGTINGAYSPVWKSVILNGSPHFQRSSETKNTVVSIIAWCIYLGAFYSSQHTFLCTLELFIQLESSHQRRIWMPLPGTWGEDYKGQLRCRNDLVEVALLKDLSSSPSMGGVEGGHMPPRWPCVTAVFQWGWPRKAPLIVSRVPTSQPLSSLLWGLLSQPHDSTPTPSANSQYTCKRLRLPECATKPSCLTRGVPVSE